MENVLIILLLVGAIAFGIVHARKHFRGGGCCATSSVVRTRKKLDAPAIGQTVLRIEGMHCENCQARVENALNRLDGVACVVNLRKKTATVSYSREISDDELRQAVEKTGYSVAKICRKKI